MAVANPSETAPAHVTVMAYSNAGTLLGQASRTVNPRSKISELLSGMIGPDLGTGWVEVTSDTAVTASLVYGDQVAGGLGALGSCSVGSRLVLPHFVQNSRWWTGIAVLNVGGAAVDATLTAYDGNGIQIQQATQSLPAKSKIMGYVEGILPNAAGKTGWILAEASTSSLAGLLIYGDKQAIPNRIGALPAMTGTTDLNLSEFRSDGSWWTGLALVNANGAAANVTLDAYAPNGVLIDGASTVINANSKVLGVVDGLFVLNGQTEGWVKVASDQPIAGFELLNADDATDQAWGLAAVESQPSGLHLTFGHYTVTSKWWTLFAMSNLSGTNPAQVTLETFGDDGHLSAVREASIPANGNLSDFLLQLLGL